MYRPFIRTVLAAVMAQAVAAIAADEAAIVVTATRLPMRASELISDVTVIEREAIAQAGGASIIDLLARQPGVQMMQNGGAGTTAELFLRGTRTDQTKIIVDGMPINSMDLKGSPLRFIPLAEVERIEIVRGAASTLYGADAVGGVIQVFTRRGAGNGGEAYAGFGSHGSQRLSAAWSGGDERWRLNLAGSDFRTRGFSALRDATRQDADRDAHHNTGVNGAVSFVPARGHELTAAWMRNRGRSYFDSTTGTGAFDSRLEFANEVWSLAGKSAVNAVWTSTLRYGQSVDDQTNFISATPSPLVTRGRQLAWQNDVKLPLGTGLVLFERQQQQAGPPSRFPGNVEVANDALALGWNASRSGHRWQWGSRRDRHSGFGDHNTWSGGYGYQIDGHWRISAAAASSFKAPTLYQLHVGTFGNAALRPESGRNREASLVWEQGGRSASLARYRNKVADMIDFSTTSNRYENIGKAVFDGWTLALGGRAGEWTLGAALDLLDARNEASGKALERRAREKLNLSAGRGWGPWQAVLEASAVGRRYNSATETQPMGGYTLVNLALHYLLSPALTLEMRGDNLTDKRYATAMTTNGRAYATPGASLFVALRYAPR